ncbi:MAG: 1-deoxy-D-xylulose-5-phosphate reductoisomerase [Acutalibacteraceae bacterium]|nr:1-deoxy-D-xylulose-5-phosphate reductoisomerase [Acutalibacteraceae bacterium]
MTEKLILLGSTGSIGVQALEVARKQNIKVTALAAGKNVSLMESQAREFKPKIAVMYDKAAAEDLKIRLKDTDIKVLSGEDGVCQAACFDGDTVLNAIVGIAGLRPTMTAIESGKTLALANKESLVTGGELVNEALKKTGGKMLPVDSEHSAIFQSLQGADQNAVSRILLTASGGPFFSKSAEELKNVTAKDALKHPNWDMGAKITIDSATLMNKGLEVIEAVHLFGVPAQKIDVVIQRESIIHSGVEFADGGMIVQMGVPDMKLPIQYALTYPKRLPLNDRLDLVKLSKLTFYKPDTKTFKCLDICIDAINQGGLKPTAANGANEMAVQLFLDGKIGFLQIAELVQAATENQSVCKNFTLDDVFKADKAAREFVLSLI